LLALAAALLAARAEGRPAPQEAEPFQTATGFVTEVRPQDKQIVLRVRKGEFLTLTADERSRIEFPQTEGKLANLKEGKRVRVTFYVKDGGNRLLSLTEPTFTLGKLKQGINLAMTFARSASIKQRDEYKKNVQAMILDLEERVAALKAKMEKADAAQKQQIAKDVAELWRQREALREQLARVDAATADNWNEVRDRLNMMLGELQRMIERANAGDRPLR
jgi:hypothetical protein